MDLRQLIDETAPTPLRLEDHLAVGRSAVRRRRLTRGAGLLGAGATVVAVAMAATALGGPSTADDAPAVATAPTASATAGGDGRAPDGIAAEYGLDGRLEIKPGWRIVERIATPMTSPVESNGPGTEEIPDASVGLAVTDGVTTQWVLTWYDAGRDGSVSSSYQLDDVGPASLQDFVDIEVAVVSGTATDAVAQVSPDGVVTGRNGVAVIDQRTTPGLDRDGLTTSVAQILLPGDPASSAYLLAVRSNDGVRTYPVFGYPVVDDPANSGPDTIDGFVDWVGPQVDAGRYP